MKSRNVSVADLGPKALAQAREQMINDAFARQMKEFGPDSLLPPDKPKRPKYGNTRTSYKSILGFERVYDSKKEAKFAADLDVALKAGFILWWLPQVSIPLPGGVIYRSDFLMMDKKKGPVWYDVKGRDTQASINKRKMVFALFGIEVQIV